MANYFVHPTNGNNLNPGTESLPWRDFTKSLSATVVAGDTVRYRGGTYVSTGHFFVSSGSVGAPITHRNYEGETPIWDLSIAVPFLGSLNFDSPHGGNYIFDGLEITSGTLGRVGEQTQDLPNIIYRNLYGHGITTPGADNVSILRIDRHADYIIEDSVFENVFSTHPTPGNNADLVKNYSAYRGIIRRCIFRNATGTGFQQKHGNPNGQPAFEMHDCVISGIDNGPCVGLFPTGTQAPIYGTNIHNCLFDGQAFLSLHTDTNAQCTSHSFNNNTVIISPNGRGWFNRGITGVEQQNNIFYGTAGGGGVNGANNSGSMATDLGTGAIWNAGWSTLRNNCYHGIGNNFTTQFNGGWHIDRNGPSLIMYDTLPAWKAATSTSRTSIPAGHESGSIVANPLFENPVLDFGGYTLAANSPCRGAGFGGVDMGWTSAVAPPVQPTGKLIVCF